MSELLPWIADALVVIGLIVLTISIGGVWRMPDLFRSLHAASIATAFGVGPILIAAGMQNGTILLRGLLVVGFMLLTSPVSAHAIARSFWRTEGDGSARAPSTAAPAQPESQSAADRPERA